MDAPSWPGVLADWTLEPAALLALALVAAVYARGRRPGRARSDLCFGAGLFAATLAVSSPVGTYSHDLLSVHMVQHLLLTVVAAPLLVASRPGRTLLAGLPVTWSDLARSWGASRAFRLVTHPLVGWTAFAVVGWAIHFSPLFDLALRHHLWHAFEHMLFLFTALLFWWPVAGGAPAGRRPLAHGLRVVSVVLAMPQNTFLALAIHSATSPLYATYVEAGRSWGPAVLADQRQGAGVMWVAGDLVLLLAVMLVASAWARDEAAHPPEDHLQAGAHPGEPAAGSLRPG